MSELSEEEIIKEVKSMFKDDDSRFWIGQNGVEAIQGLLDLYQKEKQKYNDMINCCNELMKQCNEENKRCSELAVELQSEKEKKKELEKQNKILEEIKERYLRLESDKFWDNVILKSKVREIANKRNKNNEDYKKAYFEILELLEERN